MKYKLNNITFDIPIQQDVVSDVKTDYGHKDIIDTSLKWYPRGYKATKLPPEFIQHIRQCTSTYIFEKVYQTLGVKLTELETYHQHVRNDSEHVKVLSAIGKVISPDKLGIDAKQLADIVKSECRIAQQLDYKNASDIRIFRPYTKKVMDNNPLHRDTWLEILNNCLNVYIPIAGNNAKSSISIIPGSHLWKREDVARTAHNAKINGVQYGLPSVTDIKRDYKVIRPVLKHDEVLIFSSNLIHGGAVNLNNNITRVSIEMRFWIA